MRFSTSRRLTWALVWPLLQTELWALLAFRVVRTGPASVARLGCGARGTCCGYSPNDGRCCSTWATADTCGSSTHYGHGSPSSSCGQRRLPRLRPSHRVPHMGVVRFAGCLIGGWAADRFGRRSTATTWPAISRACCLLSALAFDAPAPIFTLLCGGMGSVRNRGIRRVLNPPVRSRRTPPCWHRAERSYSDQLRAYGSEHPDRPTARGSDKLVVLAPDPRRRADDRRYRHGAVACRYLAAPTCPTHARHSLLCSRLAFEEHADVRDEQRRDS